MRFRALFPHFLLGCAFLLAAPSLTRVAAQEKLRGDSSKAAQENLTATVLLPIKYADVMDVAKVLDGFMQQIGGSVRPNQNLKVIAVSGPTTFVEACKAAVRRLDVPPAPVPNLNLTFYLLSASKNPSNSGAIPADLDPAVNQMKTLASLQGFRLVGISTIRVQEGKGAQVTGNIPALAANMEQIPYTLSFDSADRIGSHEEGRIRLRHLSLKATVSLRDQHNASISTCGLNTDVEFGDKQVAVIGTTDIRGTSDALLLVVMAHNAE